MDLNTKLNTIYTLFQLFIIYTLQFIRSLLLLKSRTIVKYSLISDTMSLNNEDVNKIFNDEFVFPFLK